MTRLSNSQLFFFALPWFVSAVMHGPIAGIIPTLYASEFGLDLALIGTVLLIARVFDAVTDPMIGFLSDRTVSRHGKRKPWVVAGAALTVISIWFLYRPGDTASTTYLLVFAISLYLGWTIMEIPAVAWILEMSRDTTQRTRINAARTVATFVGGILFFILPALVPGSDGSMNFQVLGLVAIGVVVGIPITTFLMVKLVPQGDVASSEKPPKIAELWGSIKNNRPFLYFLAVYLFIGIANGIVGVLGFLYVDSYLQIGTRFTELFLPAMLIGPLTIPLWVWVLNRFGKYRVTVLAFAFYTLLMPLPWFVQPGPSAFLPMLIYNSVVAAFAPLLMVSMPAMLGDIIDYDELETGKNRAGQYSSFLTLLAKGVAAIAGPLTFVIVGLYGYQPGAENDAAAITGLRVIYNIAPAIVIIPGIFLLWRFPINDDSQLKIKEQLEARLDGDNTEGGGDA